MPDQPVTVSRRTVLKSAAGVAAAAALGSPLLAACSGDAGSDTADSDAAVKLPQYTPVSLRPDLPGTASGILASWTQYPTSLTPAPSPPGKGAAVTALVPLFTPPPPQLPGNAFWSQVNKRFGMQWKPTLAPADTFVQKIQTSIAGGDVPDIVLFSGNIGVPSNATIPHQPQALKSLFADLTEHLSGDAVAKYKNLANIPTPAWTATVANGGIYGVPITRGLAAAPFYVRRDLIEAAGVHEDPTTLDDFLAFCKEITDAKRSHWAIAAAGDAMAVANAAYGTPNLWRESGGKLTADVETDEYLHALEFSAKLHKAGLIYPDVATTGSPVKQVFGSGRALLHVDSDSAWGGYLIDNAKTQGFKLGAILPPKGASGGGRLPANGATFGYTAFKKASKSRIEELLAITDLSAANFGTDTWQFLNFGVVGIDSTRSSTGPMLNDRGNLELNCNVRYLGSAPPTNYIAGYPEQTRMRYDYQRKTVPQLVLNPVDGLYSPTLGAKGASLFLLITNALNDVVLGRKPVSSWADTLKTWRSTGGDAMRHEFEQALAHKPRK